MPFVAATGLNYETANSYITVEYADAYFSDRGNTAWTGTTQAKQAALIKATDYIEQVYSGRWRGVVVRTVGLSWPRIGALSYTSEAIPEPLKKATAELALEALASELNPVTPAKPIVKRRKVDVIETEFDTTRPVRTLRPAVAGLLSSLLLSSGINVQVVRA